MQNVIILSFILTIIIGFHLTPPHFIIIINYSCSTTNARKKNRMSSARCIH